MGFGDSLIMKKADFDAAWNSASAVDDSTSEGKIEIGAVRLLFGKKNYTYTDEHGTSVTEDVICCYVQTRRNADAFFVGEVKLLDKALGGTKKQTTLNLFKTFTGRRGKSIVVTTDSASPTDTDKALKILQKMSTTIAQKKARKSLYTEINPRSFRYRYTVLPTGKNVYELELPGSGLYPYVKKDTRKAYLVVGEHPTKDGECSLYYFGHEAYARLSATGGFSPDAVVPRAMLQGFLPQDYSETEYSEIKKGDKVFVVADQGFVNGESVSLKIYMGLDKKRLLRLPLIDPSQGLEAWFNGIKTEYDPTGTKSPKIVKHGHIKHNIPLKIAELVLAGVMIFTVVFAPIVTTAVNAEKSKQAIVFVLKNEATEYREAAIAHGREQMKAIIAQQDLVDVVSGTVDVTKVRNLLNGKIGGIEIYKAPEENVAKYLETGEDAKTLTLRGALEYLAEEMVKEIVREGGKIVDADGNTIVHYVGDKASMAYMISDLCGVPYPQGAELVSLYGKAFENKVPDYKDYIDAIGGQGTEEQIQIDYAAPAVKSSVLDTIAKTTDNGGKLSDVTIAYANDDVVFAYGGNYIYKLEFAEGTQIETEQDFVTAVSNAKVTEGMNAQYMFSRLGTDCQKALENYTKNYCNENNLESAEFFITDGEIIEADGTTLKIKPSMIVLEDNGSSMKEVSLYTTTSTNNASITKLNAVAMLGTSGYLPSGYTIYDEATTSTDYDTEDNKVSSAVGVSSLNNSQTTTSTNITETGRDRG